MAAVLRGERGVSQRFVAAPEAGQPRRRRELTVVTDGWGGGTKKGTIRAPGASGASVMTETRREAAEATTTVLASVDDLVASQQVRLFRLAVCICGDRDLAEEAVAEAFARAWPALQRGTVNEPAAYLRRAVINVLQGRFRRAALERRVRERRQRVDDTAHRDQSQAVVERDAVLGALQQLPIRQRQVMVLRYYEGLSEAEVADVLHMPAGTVKSTASRAAARLRVLLEGNHD